MKHFVNSDGQSNEDQDGNEDGQEGEGNEVNKVKEDHTTGKHVKEDNDLVKWGSVDRREHVKTAGTLEAPKLMGENITVTSRQHRSNTTKGILKGTHQEIHQATHKETHEEKGKTNKKDKRKQRGLARAKEKWQKWKQSGGSSSSSSSSSMAVDTALSAKAANTTHNTPLFSNDTLYATTNSSTSASIETHKETKNTSTKDITTKVRLPGALQHFFNRRGGGVDFDGKKSPRSKLFEDLALSRPAKILNVFPMDHRIATIVDLWSHTK